MSLMRYLFRALRISNDVRALKRGTLHKRVARRHVRRATRRSIRRIMK